MATQSVKVPVELEMRMKDISSQIEQIRKAIGQVKPDTKGYQHLETLLKSIEHEFQNIKKQSTESFSTHGQINTFGRKFEHLQGLAKDFGEEFKKLDFSAFKDSAFDKTFVDQINSAQDSIAALKEEISNLGNNAFLQTAKSSQELVNTLQDLKAGTIESLVDEEKNIKALENIKKSSKSLQEELKKVESSKKTKTDAKDREERDLRKKEVNLTSARQSYAALQKNVADATAELERFKKVQESIQTQQLKKQSSRVEDNLNRLNVEKANLKNKTGRANSDFFDGKGEKLSKTKLIQHLLKDYSFTNDDLEKAGVLSLTEQSLDTFYKNLATLLKEKKAEFDEKINTINKDVQNAESALKKAQTEEGKGKQTLETAQDFYDAQKKEVDQLATEISSLEKRANNIQATIDRNTAAATALGKANSDKVTAMGSASQIQQIADLEKRIEELENQLRSSIKAFQDTENATEGLSNGAKGAEGPLNNMENSLDQVTESTRRLENIQGAIKRWFGFNEVINLTKRAVRDAINHIRELDKVMTEIAVVTDMGQEDLWGQISTYSRIAQEYGVSTVGVYEVSQLYYQQGLATAEVMQLTEETLKMAKIANIDYADATDYMTVAIRGFKLEMSDAQNIVDVYSNIAAVTASDTEELAVAMSKTASSAEAVGASFENTTAMIALMVETTREAPQNIGSALKSIISRYGEMTSDPSAIVDSEGEEMSLNRVDKALKSIGISLQDTSGQFRDFDEVILELSSKWGTLDVNTQRYIATIMAGNRQQSRFLALVGNYDRLSELYEEAANSQDAATLQTLKTMDSIETKINQLKTAFQEFYTSTGIENLIKGVIDFVTVVIERINGIPKAFDKIPLAAIGMIGTLITTGKMGLSVLIGSLFKTFNSYLPEVKVEGVKMGEAVKEGFELGIKGMGEKAQKELKISKLRAKWGTALASIGSLVSTLALTLGDLETAQGRVISGWVQIAGGAASAIGQVLTGNYIGAAITAVSTLTSAIATMEETTEEKIDRLKKNVEESSNESLLSKNELKTLIDYKKKYEELFKSQYKSIEAKQEFLDLQNEIAASYPSLISGMDDEGNYLISLGDNYERLLDLKQKNYALSLQQKQLDEIAYYADPDTLFEELGGNAANWDTSWWNAPIGDNSDLEKFYKSFQQEGFWTNNPYQQIYDQIKFYGQQYWFGDPNKGVAGLDTDFLKTFLAEGFFFNGYNDIVGPDGTIYKNASNEQIISAITEALFNGLVIDESSPFYGLELVDSSYYSDIITRKAAGDIQNSELVTKYIEEQAIPELIQSQLNYLGIDLDQIQLDQLTADIIEDFNNDRGNKTAVEYYKTFSNNILFKDGFFQDYIDTISEDILNASEEINEIYSSRETYAYDDYIASLKNAGASDEVITIAVEKWQEGIEEAKQNFINGILENAKNDKGYSMVYVDYYNMQDLLNNIPRSLYDLVSSQFEYALRNVETDPSQAQKAIDSLTNFYYTLNELGPDAERIAANADLTSLSGIETMFEEMERAGIDISKIDLTNWINTLTVNLDIEWETYFNKIAEGMKNFETAISNASSGMNLEEAIAMANKLGVTLDNFRFEDGKYFYDDLDSLTKAYQDFSNRLRTNLEEQTNQIKSFVADYNEDNDTWKLKDEIVAGITGITDEGFEFDDEVDAELQTFLSSRFEAYQAWLKKNYKGESGLGRINEFILFELESLDDSTNQMINEYQKRLLAMAALSAKNLIRFFEEMALDTEEQAKILEALKTGDTSGLSGDALRIYYEYEDELTGLITSTISDMTDAALEAISSGKAQRVNITNLNQYNKKLYDQISLGQLANAGISFQQEGAQSYALIGSNVSESIYKQFLNAMNYTDEQYNEAVVEFFNAKTKDVEGALDSVLSDVNKVDYSVIADFATAIGMNIDEILTTGIFTLNPDKLTYRIQDFGRLEQEVQGKVTYAQEMIRDSISNYLDEVFGYVSNGISGSMSNVEFAQLQDFISGYDPNLKLQITETADGLKLTQDSVLQVYSILKVISPLAAQVTLKELAESAMDADERLNDIYFVLDKIAAINTEIEDAKISPDRKRELLAELGIAKNIRDTLIESGNAFNFMNRDMRTDLTNPYSAWEGYAQAIQILSGEDWGAGKANYQDLANMIDMMTDANGMLMSVGDGSIEAAEYLKAAANAFTISDTGEFYVDLEKLGEQFNISAEEMSSGIYQGLAVVAQAQIDLLTAKKNILIGAQMWQNSETLKEIAKDGFSFSEIFKAEEGLITGFQDGFIESFENFDFNIENYLGLAEEQVETFLIGLDELYKLIEQGADSSAIEKKVQEISSGLSAASDTSEVQEVKDTFDEVISTVTTTVEAITAGIGEAKDQVVGFAKEAGQAISDILNPESSQDGISGFLKGIFKKDDDSASALGAKANLGELKVGYDRAILVDESGTPITNIEISKEDYTATANISVLEGKIGEGTTTEPVSTGTITFTKNDLDSWGLTGDLNTLTGLYDEAKITKETDGLEGIEKIEIPLTEENVLTAVGTLDTIISSYQEGKTDSKVSGAVTVNDIPLTDASVLVALGILNTVKARYEKATTKGVVSEKVVLEGLDLAPGSVLKAIGILDLITGKQDNSTDTSTEKVTAENIPLAENSSLKALGTLNVLIAKYVEGKTTDDISGLEKKEFNLGKTLSAKGEISKATVTLTPKTEIIPSGNKEFEINGSDFNFKITKSNENGEIEDLTISIPVEPNTKNLDGLTNRIKETLIAQGFSAGQAGEAANDLVLAATVQVGDNYTPSEKLDEIASLISSENNTVDIIVKEDGSEKVQTAVNDLIEKNKDKVINIDLNITTGQIKNRASLIQTYDPILEEFRDFTYDEIGILQSYYEAGLELDEINKEQIMSMYENWTNDAYLDVYKEKAEEVSNTINTIAKTIELANESLAENNSDSLTDTVNNLDTSNLSQIVQAIIDLTQNSTILSTLSFDQFNSFISSLSSAVGPDSQAAAGLNTIKSTLEELSGEGYQIDLTYKVNNGLETDGTYTLEVNDNQTITTLMDLATALFTLNTQASTLIKTANSMTDNGPSQVSAMSDAMDDIRDRSWAVRNTANAIKQLSSKDITATITVEILGAGHISSTKFELANAGGNFAYAKGTLMGELGPELVVSGGRYYTVGNYGAEFVDLPSDAIVFNHLQTKKLLNNGSISSTGTPKESEKKSVAMATGNVTGPARAKSTDDEIKEIDDVIRFWQSLINFGAKDLGTKAAGGAGGKGGEIDPGFLGDLERWYNLLRQIAKLEQQISYEQAYRANLQSGYDYVISLEKELRILEKQQDTYSKLAKLQKDYYDKRREELQTTQYSKIFTYDEDGLMQYVEGENRGLDILATLNETDAQGVAKRTAKQQVDYLKGLGFDISEFMRKSDGTKIEATDYTGIIEQFWTGIDNWMSELDGLYDEYNDHLVSIQENQEAQQEIAQEYIDNERSFEDKLFQAIEDREQAEIDRQQENLEAMQKSTSAYLAGLNESLDKERKMYNRNEENEETTRLQRQLAILQRTGGSASEIKSLQDQIDSRLKDAYFQEQEDQIQAIEDASRVQLEKMQEQIDLMTEALEYQKENGLLWNEVTEMIRDWTPEALVNFIETYTKSYKEDSLLENEQKSEEAFKEAEIIDARKQEAARKASWENYIGSTNFEEDIVNENRDAAEKAYLEALRAGKTEDEAKAAADTIFGNAIKAREENKQQEQKPTEDEEKKEEDKKGNSYWLGYYTHPNGSRMTTNVGYNTRSEAERAAQRAFEASLYGYANKEEIRAKTNNGSISAKFFKYAYKEGGLVDFTGPAWVDGTKSKPEAFLSAEDTALLKSKIFSNSNYSLRSVIDSLQALGQTFSSIDNSSASNITFENVNIEIQSGVISSDYDAKRAGEQVFDEFVKIARRSSNLGMARR